MQFMVIQVIGLTLIIIFPQIALWLPHYIYGSQLIVNLLLLIVGLGLLILGAELIEIHITSDKTKKFIDNNVSFDYLELEKLVESIRKIERMKI